MRCVLGSLLLLVATLAMAGGLQSHEQMRSAAAEFLTRQTSDASIEPRIEVARPDPRLRLAACELPLTAFLPPGGRAAGNVAVGVRCDGARPWTVYLTASVRIHREVVVLSRPLPRGTTLAADDLRLEVRDTTSLHGGYMDSLEEALGMVTRRPLASGSVLAGNAVAPPRLVQRGQQVVLVARAGGLEVRSAGKALNDGAAGELIRVQNSLSSRVVEALVTAPGTATVQF